jgi:hypothetical protein
MRVTPKAAGAGLCASVCVLLRCEKAEEREGGEAEEDVGERSGGGDETRGRRSLQRGGRDEDDFAAGEPADYGVAENFVNDRLEAEREDANRHDGEDVDT